MFLLVAVIAVAVFYLWLKGSRVKAEARHSLRCFRHSAGAPDGSVGTDWTFDFEAMSLVVTRFNSDPRVKPKDPTTHYAFGGEMTALGFPRLPMRRASIAPLAFRSPEEAVDVADLE
jgi:hypothetical protein